MLVGLVGGLDGVCSMGLMIGWLVLGVLLRGLGMGLWFCSVLRRVRVYECSMLFRLVVNRYTLDETIIDHVS